eukprot:189616_1
MTTNESATRPSTHADSEHLIDAEDILPIAQDLIGGLITDVQLLTQQVEKLTEYNRLITHKNVTLEERLRSHELNELKLMAKVMKRERQILELVMYIKEKEMSIQSKDVITRLILEYL